MGRSVGNVLFNERLFLTFIPILHLERPNQTGAVQSSTLSERLAFILLPVNYSFYLQGPTKTCKNLCRSNWLPFFIRSLQVLYTRIAQTNRNDSVAHLRSHRQPTKLWMQNLVGINLTHEQGFYGKYPFFPPLPRSLFKTSASNTPARWERRQQQIMANYQGKHSQKYICKVSVSLIKASATLIVLIAAHLSMFALTATRLVSQYRRQTYLWHDDILAALAACGGLFTIGCLTSMGS